MEGVAKLFWVFAICMLVMAQLITAAEESRGKELINKVCEKSEIKDLCIEVLSSDPVRSPNANLKDLAIVSLKVAANNASSILSDAKMLIDDDNLDPDVQQGLADCKENILDAGSQLEDSIAALLVGSHADAKVWLKAALAAITTCDDSIPGDDDILSVKSHVFRKLCNIAVEINSLMAKSS
ncbi:pectinesterase inhibitor-like [Abrus precatorius]|uniref:Pectinesterase inhibitor-like n=1 Tax=Abrus precatorius TaxID=3816 RepID=A0A8B8KUW9_ABRPR|nr:pectinesterase inhibitor-like [Abrus precatorius]